MVYFKYPCRVIVFDDNKKFLEMLESVLSTSFPHIEFYSEGKKFLDTVENLKILSLPEFKKKKTHSCLKIRDNKEKNKQISVIIMDYKLNYETGLDLLSKITDKNIFKILLTGIADEKVAIDAFNQGLINAYLKKPTNNEELIKQIKFGEDFYFENLSRSFETLFEGFNSEPQNLFGGKDFQRFFNGIIVEKNIEEYYLLDKNGSYLMIDKDKCEHTFLIMSEKSKRAQLDILDAENAPKSLIDEVKNYKKMLYIDEMFYTHNKDYQSWIVPASSMLINSHKFNYAVVPGNFLKSERY